MEPPAGIGSVRTRRNRRCPLENEVVSSLVGPGDLALVDKLAYDNSTSVPSSRQSSIPKKRASTKRSGAALHREVLYEMYEPNVNTENELDEGADDDNDDNMCGVSNGIKRRQIVFSSPSSSPMLPRHDPSSSSTTMHNGVTSVENLPLPSPSASPNHQGTFHDIDNDKCALLHIPTWSMIDSYIDNIEPGSIKSKSLLWKLLQKTDITILSSLYGLLADVLKTDIVNQLPIEITNKIFSHFDYKTLVKASEVCKEWNLITHYSYDTWKSLLFKDKMINDETEFEREFKWVKSIQGNLKDSQIAKLMYKRRLGIKKDWMNPTFSPKVISLDAKNLGVITCLQFDGDKIAAGSDQSKVVIYDTETGDKRHELIGHGGGVWAMKYYKNTLASGSTDRTVRIWNIAQGKCTHIFKGHVSTVRCLEIIEPVERGTDIQGNPIYFPPEPLLVTGSRDTTLNVWKLPLTKPNDILPDEPIELEEIDNPFLLKKLEGHSNSVRALSGHCDTIISGSYDNKAIVWDLKTFTKKYELIGHNDRIYSCVYDWKRNQCYTGSVDNTVKIWDLNKGSLKAILEGHQILVGLITASDNLLVSAAADSTVRIWDPDTGASKHVLRGHGSAITCVENDDEKIVSGSQGSLILWNAQTGEKVRDLGTNISGAVWQVKFDYKRCVAAVQRDSETVIEITDFCPRDQDPYIHFSSNI